MAKKVTKRSKTTKSSKIVAISIDFNSKETSFAYKRTKIKG